MNLFRSAVPLITGILLSLAACGDRGDGPGQPGPSSLGQIYTVTPAELRRLPRAFAFEQAVFLEFSPDFPELRLFEWTRAQNPKSYQAEQRGFFYNYLRGFQELPAAGPVLLPDGYGDIRRPVDSEHLLAFGDPRSGWRLEIRGMGLAPHAFGHDYELHASPLHLLHAAERGLAEYRLYTGPAVRVDRGERHGVLLWFESMYLPAVNPFESAQVGTALSVGRMQFWLHVPEVRSVLFLEVGANDALAPMLTFQQGVRIEVEGGGGRARKLDSLELRVTDRRGAEDEERSPAAWEGTLASDGECKAFFEEIHGTTFYSLARGRSRLSSVRGRLDCDGEQYSVTGFARTWPDE